ncbi:flagellar biosynthesis protein FliO [Variovorax beijingensis]|uniref:Flagellar biosynthesis protein FliO n=1 Tax=Variovorax beijingensis TaxID=2496117 RepID=A0A561C3U7_9BURK|nr:flagellar biosynthetic protein FliO [Variovorax beijingensis]TWD85744.1 flagellar biosynthesis protein FliO [Variovorax beijingensis]
MGVAMVAGLLLASPGAAQEAPAGGAESRPASSLPDSIPVKREQPNEMTGPASDRWWMAIAMAGGLLALVVVIARRRAGVAKPPGAWRTRFGGLLDTIPSHEIQRVSSMPLSQRHSLHVVVWNGRRLLLGCTEQSIQLLAETSSATEGAEPAPGAPGEPR